MLPPVCDLGLAIRQILRLGPHTLSSKVVFCTGCQRQLSTLRWQQPQKKKVLLTFSLVLPYQKCPFAVSANHHLWRTELLGRASDPPSKSSATGNSESGVKSPDMGASASPLSAMPLNEGAGASGNGKDISPVSSAASAAGISGGEERKQEDGEVKTQKLLKVKPKPRKAKPIDYTYTGNVYILPVRAMNEFLLKPSDLEELPRYERRSPYESGPRITVFLRTDVETIAKQVWGSLENIKKEKAKIHKADRGSTKYDIFQIRAVLDEHKKLSGIGDEKPYVLGEEPKTQSEWALFWKSGSARVVMSAIFINGLNSILKFIAWLYTGSHSMFSEFVHSVADTMNQIILGVGLYHSIKKPDPDHPYGYTNLRNISSLISGVGIFFFGTGLSLYHGFQGLIHPELMTSLNWGIATLIGAFVSEGATLIIAANQVRKSSKAMNLAFWDYVRQGIDPNVTVVLLEDMAAVAGVGVAAVCMTTAQYMGSSIPDAIGSFLIGGILGAVASFVIYTNTSALVGKSIPFNVRQQISQDLEGDRMIRSLHDVKATHMGGHIRFKAEIDFDGREITRAYLYKQDLDLLLTEMKELQTAEDVEAFMLKHGERIIDTLGEEVDRIEKALKKKYPDLRHMDLEAL